MLRVYRMVSASDGIFHIAYQGVNPGEFLFGDTLWSAACDNSDMVATMPIRLPQVTFRGTI